MALDLYYFPLSPGSRAVVVTARHLDIDLNLKEVDILKGEQNSDELVNMNPTHKVPILVDGDFNLWESRAIMRYLCNKYAPDSTLYPSDPQKRASVDQMLDFDTSLFQAIHAILANQFQGNESTEQQLDNFHKYLKFAEVLVTDRKFVVNDELTIADISIAHNLAFLEHSDFKDAQAEDCPNLVTYYNGIKDESVPFKEGSELAKEAYEKWIAEKQKTE